MDDKGIGKILREALSSRQPQDQRPAEIKRTAKSFIARHGTQFFDDGKLKILFFSAVKRVDAHFKGVGESRQDLRVGCAAALPFGNRLRRDPDQVAELFLRKVLLIAVFLDLLSDDAHFQPSVD